jgi:leucyl-tRNA synthetase
VENIEHSSLNEKEKIARRKVYEALKKSNEVLNKTFAFNTLIASCMEAMNALNDQINNAIWTEGYYILSNILEPIIPHTCWEISNELFKMENFKKPLEIKEEVFVLDTIPLAVTVNGKKRAEIQVSPNETKENILATAKQSISKWLEDKQIIKEIVVPKKLVNIVVK